MNELRYTTEDLSKLFSVGKSTIKRWTDEGKLQCYKTPGGHRKFKPSNILEFVSQYHYELTTPLSPILNQMPEATDGIYKVNVEECFMHAVTGKRLLIEQSFFALFSQGKTLPMIFDTLLTPVLRMIHAKFQHRQITSVEFQISKNTLIHSLIHFTDQIPKTEKKDVELYCLTVNEGMNEVELKAVELLLENFGLTVYNLGTVLTKYAAHDIVGQCKPEDVFVVLSLDHSTDEIIQQFNALVSGVHAYGGSVFTSNFFGENISETVETQSKQFHSFTEIVEQLLIIV